MCPSSFCCSVSPTSLDWTGLGQLAEAADARQESATPPSLKRLTARIVAPRHTDQGPVVGRFIAVGLIAAMAASVAAVATHTPGIRSGSEECPFTT